MLKNLPPASRPREKLIANGAAALTDAELLAIFLRCGTKGINVIELADQTLQRFGGLRALLTANQADFMQQKGLGQAQYVQLQAVLELSRRHFKEQLVRGCTFSNPQDVKSYLLMLLRDREREHFWVLFLDNQNRLIAEKDLFQGSINAAVIYPREIIKQALDFKANAIILAHNHPSGLAEPSSADKQVTSRIQAALDLVDIRLLDHMVVGETDVVSFAERGLI